MPDKMEWLTITGLWKSGEYTDKNGRKRGGNPNIFLSSREKLQAIIDKLNNALNKADFSGKNGVILNISPVSAKARRANPNRPIWLVKVGMRHATQTQPQAPQEPVQTPTEDTGYSEAESVPEPVGSFDSEY